MVAKRNQVLRLFVSGRRAGSIAARVGSVVARTDRATQRAAATAARRAAPIVKRHVTRIFNVKPAALNGRVRAAVTGPKNKADTLRVYAHTRRLALMLFGGAWGGTTTPGATASVLRGQSEIYVGSFIAAVGKKKLRSIRVRKWVGGRRAPRGPLQILSGPSPHDMVTGHRADPENRNPMGRYPVQLDRAIGMDIADVYVAELVRQLALETRNG